MSAHRNALGSSFDDLMIGRRRLAIGHCLAALIVIVGLWLQIGPKYFAAALTFRIGGILVFTTAVAWFPILFSYLLARQFIFGRRQVRNYLLCLTPISTVSAFAYSGQLGAKISVYAVSIIASLLLGLCLVFCGVVAVTSPDPSLERTRDG